MNNYIESTDENTKIKNTNNVMGMITLIYITTKDQYIYTFNHVG